MVDCFAYLGLYVAIRYRNWLLRTGSIKLLASAFDHPIYQCLISWHLNDLFSLPEPILVHLQNGGFSARLTATEWHGVALDERHEMQINKDAKLVLVSRSSEQKMDYLSDYLPYCSTCLRNLKELFPQTNRATEEVFEHGATSKDKIFEINVQRMLEAVKSHGLFYNSETNQGLWNFLANKQVTHEQLHDLLAFRSIGQEEFENYVSTKFLRQPSTKLLCGKIA